MARKTSINQALMINFVATLSIMVFAPMAEAQSQRSLGNCIVIVDGNRLSIIGNEKANTIGIAGSDSGVQVMCDGTSDSFDRIDSVTVEARDGDDQTTIDNSNGLLGGKNISVFAGAGNDTHTLIRFTVPLPNIGTADLVVDGGPGDDVLRIVSGALDDQFDVRRGEALDAVEVQVTDIATGMVTGNIVGSGVEMCSIKMGAGNDVFNQFGSLPTVLSVFGEAGFNAGFVTFPPGEKVGTVEPTNFSGGSEHDKFTYKGTTASEQYEIAGVPDLRIPDPELRVTDMVTGLELAHVQFLDVEDVTIEANDGDDRVEVNWDAALMRGLSFIHADLGRGNDTFVANLLPVLTEPPTREVQIAQCEVDTGSGNDQVAFSHSAASWFDVLFTVDTGPGTDTVNAALLPPPDNGIIGPAGLRQVQFNMVTGGDDDFVAFRNETNGDFSNVFLHTELGGGNDTFEGIGDFHEAKILPGRDFDTARVTRNFLPFVREFERVEILD